MQCPTAAAYGHGAGEKFPDENDQSELRAALLSEIGIIPLAIGAFQLWCPLVTTENALFSLWSSAVRRSTIFEAQTCMDLSRFGLVATPGSAQCCTLFPWTLIDCWKDELGSSEVSLGRQSKFRRVAIST